MYGFLLMPVNGLVIPNDNIQYYFVIGKHFNNCRWLYMGGVLFCGFKSYFCHKRRTACYDSRTSRSYYRNYPPSRSN